MGGKCAAAVLVSAWQCVCPGQRLLPAPTAGLGRRALLLRLTVAGCSKMPRLGVLVLILIKVPRVASVSSLRSHLYLRQRPRVLFPCACTEGGECCGLCGSGGRSRMKRKRCGNRSGSCSGSGSDSWSSGNSISSRSVIVLLKVILVVLVILAVFVLLLVRVDIVVVKSVAAVALWVLIAVPIPVVTVPVVVPVPVPITVPVVYNSSRIRSINIIMI